MPERIVRLKGVLAKRCGRLKGVADGECGASSECVGYFSRIAGVGG
ncbi:MAG: hypothetical protein ACI4S9_01565 [Christensenellales bacterium]